MPRFIPPGLGWHRDLPDPRDYSPGHKRVRPLLAGLKRNGPSRGAAPAVVDWREFFPPVECQLEVASCAAHACVTLAEYYERRASGRSVEGSRLFLHQMARQLARGTGNCGVSLRQTLKALAQFGLPPEEHWPYDVRRLDDPPHPYLFSLAADYSSLVYLRLDQRPSNPSPTLAVVKSFLAAGFPVAFGFTVFNSLSREALIPFPTCFDAARGGQAVVALGYKDGLRIRSEKGALLICNSWGTDWGEEGYGWLPYRYVEQQLAADFWALLRPDWLASEEFSQPV